MENVVWHNRQPTCAMKNGMAQAPLIAAMGHETPRLTWRTLESRTWPCALAGIGAAQSRLSVLTFPARCRGKLWDAAIGTRSNQCLFRDRVHAELG